jgi:hypothetical protein
MQRLAASRGAQFVIFMAGEDPTGGGEPTEGTGEVVHALNGKYYKTSKAQYAENLNYLTQGFATYYIPVKVVPPVVGPEDAHLNEHATDQVMKDLAAKIEHLPPARR